MRGWQGQPRKVVEYEYWQKKSQTFDRWAVGCNLVVLKRVPPQPHCKIQAPFSATPCEQGAIQGA
jgi:hypothetical protein